MDDKAQERRWLEAASQLCEDQRICAVLYPLHTNKLFKLARDDLDELTEEFMCLIEESDARNKELTLPAGDPAATMQALAFILDDADLLQSFRTYTSSLLPELEHVAIPTSNMSAAHEKHQGEQKQTQNQSQQSRAPKGAVSRLPDIKEEASESDRMCQDESDGGLFVEQDTHHQKQGGAPALSMVSSPNACSSQQGKSRDIASNTTSLPHHSAYSSTTKRSSSLPSNLSANGMRMALPSGDIVCITPLDGSRSSNSGGDRPADSRVLVTCTARNDCDLLFSVPRGAPLELASLALGAITATSLSNLAGVFGGGFEVARMRPRHALKKGAGGGAWEIRGCVAPGTNVLVRLDGEEVLVLSGGRDGQEGTGAKEWALVETEEEGGVGKGGGKR